MVWGTGSVWPNGFARITQLVNIITEVQTQTLLTDSLKAQHLSCPLCSTSGETDTAVWCSSAVLVGGSTFTAESSLHSDPNCNKDHTTCLLCLWIASHLDLQAYPALPRKAH